MTLRRIILALAALLLAASAFAASVAERSPFAQGHWWDPGRSGNGFDIFNAAGNVQVIWYTFDEAGRPVWYTAQGTVASLGQQAWPLLRHRWADGRKADAATVGSMRLTVRHTESLDVAWDIGGKTGTWTIQPLILSGMANGLDRSGSYYDPNNSGWGISLLEQGDVLGGVLFTYDTVGAPTWVAGFERDGNGSAAMYAAAGSCPYCPAKVTTTRGAGRLSYEFQSEIRLGLRVQLDAPMAAGINADGARLEMFSRPASWRAADRQLANFDEGTPLHDYLAAGMLNVGISPIVVLPSASPSVAFSTTNLQEAGVDESDLVKSNGRQVYAYAHNASGMRIPVIRVVATDNNGATLAVRTSVPLASGASSPMSSAGLFLDGDNLVSVTGTVPQGFYYSPWTTSGSWLRGTTNVEVLGVANPDLPATRWRAEIEGHVVASRRIGTRLYVVTRSVPVLTGFSYGVTIGTSAYSANQALVAGTPLSSLLPKVRVNDGAASVALGPTSVFVPPQGGRKPTAEMTLVTVIDLAPPRIVQTLGIAGPVETVYASPANLFLASSRYDLRSVDGALLPAEPPIYITDIHQIALGATAMSIVGSGPVEGYLGTDADKAAFRLGEQDGRLRVVTSSAGMWGSEIKNRLTILEPSIVSPGLLRTVSWLPNKARPESLGKPGELLYGTRFVGERLYAVTFKMIDPLYVVDLSNASDPRIAGQVAIPGFSDYLHPLPNNLLLGFGKDAVPAAGVGDGQFAWYQGLKLSLFDVGNAGQPREIQSVVIGKRGSDSALLRQHHAFSSVVQPDGSTQIAIPARIAEGNAPLYGSGDSAWYPWSRSGLLRFELRGSTAADARLSALPTLVTHFSLAVGGTPPPTDASADGARSVLFRNGVIYYGNGYFWQQDTAGNSAGPF